MNVAINVRDDLVEIGVISGDQRIVCMLIRDEVRTVMDISF